MKPWWRGIPAAETTVNCAPSPHWLRWEAGELHALEQHLHRLRWEAGELRALDHDDIEGERALAARGGQRCVCVDVLEAWERQRENPRVLVLASRGPADQFASHHDPSQPLIARLSPAAMQQPEVEPEAQLIELLALGGGLPERLTATVAATWRERLARPADDEVASVRPQLEAALYGRVLAALQPWLQNSVGELRLRMVDEEHAPSLAADNGGVWAELPFGWIVDVWSRGLAMIFGRFCLAADTDDGRTWRLETLASDFEQTEMMTIELSPNPSRDPR